MRNLAIALFLGCIFLGCNAAKTTSRNTDTYSTDMSELAEMVSQYVRHWDTYGEWPDAGTYQTANLIYKGTEPTSTTFPERRRDFYRTLHRGGLELDLILWSDGRSEVKIFSH